MPTTETKAAAIRRLSEASVTPKAIADHLKTTTNYVHMSLWRAKHPGYGARWMAQKRRKDPAYYAAELERQAIKERERHHG